MQQKIIQIGNSIGVVIPQAIRRKTGMQSGNTIDIINQGDKIIVSPIRKHLAKGVNAKFIKDLDGFIEEHEDVLRVLANR